MKTKYLILLGLCATICIIPVHMNSNKEEKIVEDEVLQSGNTEEVVEVIEEEPLYYGKTKEELIKQINKSLKSTLSNKGEVIVNYSIEYGVDPYLATAIMLHETGCKWGCSSLVKKCNNVAGQKGGPSCNGGSYKRYDTLDEGIKGAIYNLSVNYIKKGLTTTTQINKKYAEDKTWHVKIDKYINEIKSK